MTIWVKSSIILRELAQIFFLEHFKTNKIFNFVKFVAISKGMTTNFFSPLSFHAVLVFLDPGSEIRIPDPGWVKIRIRDKHPGSATLEKTINE